MATHIICRIYSCMNKALSVEPSGNCFSACWIPHNENLADNYFHSCGIILPTFPDCLKETPQTVIDCYWKTPKCLTLMSTLL